MKIFGINQICCQFFLSCENYVHERNRKLLRKVGADVDKVRLGMGSDDRIGHRFFSQELVTVEVVFPKDVKALIKSGKEKILILKF